VYIVHAVPRGGRRKGPDAQPENAGNPGPIRWVEARSSALKRIPTLIAVYDVYNDPALSFVGSLEG